MKKVTWILFALLIGIVLFLGVIAFLFEPKGEPRSPQVNFTGPSGEPFVKGPAGPPPGNSQ
jgi:hypothetical protein